MLVIGVPAKPKYFVVPAQPAPTGHLLLLLLRSVLNLPTGDSERLPSCAGGNINARFVRDATAAIFIATHVAVTVVGDPECQDLPDQLVRGGHTVVSCPNHASTDAGHLTERKREKNEQFNTDEIWSLRCNPCGGLLEMVRGVPLSHTNLTTRVSAHFFAYWSLPCERNIKMVVLAWAIFTGE